MIIFFIMFWNGNCFNIKCGTDEHGETLEELSCTEYDLVQGTNRI